MSKKSRKRLQNQPPVAGLASSSSKRRPDLIPLAGLAGFVLIFFWIQLTSSQTTIQWDAVDVHYSNLKYFADSIKLGRWPSWTPYIFSGFPFLSDIQTGVWYPLNWPLFVFGVTPWGIQASLALHSLLAAWGMYFLALRFLENRGTAVLAGMLYAFSGFFVAHSSHVGMYQAATLLPLLLHSLSKSFDTKRPRWIAADGALIGSTILTGHFQTALYSCSAAALFAAAYVVHNRGSIRSVAVCLLLAVVAGVLLSSVQVIPALELARNSIRARSDYSTETNSPLVPSALSTLIFANALGAVSDAYHGPQDVTQFYFCAGIALLPLSLVGLRNPSVRRIALVIAVPSIWYALGPKAGFYRVLASLPGFASVRAPVHLWFVPALALALLAAAGLQLLAHRFSSKSLVWILLAFCFGDVYYWNSLSNPLAYARASFAEMYGQNFDIFRERIAPHIPPLTRLHLPASTQSFGPLNHPLGARVETTYGYNPLELAAYADYIAASDTNPRLLDTLGVRYRGIPGKQGLIDNPGTLPRVHFPGHVIAVHSISDANKEISRLNPAQDAVLVAASAPTQDPVASATVTEYGETAFRVRYRSGTRSLLRIGMPYFPGWQASVGGQPHKIVPVDYALSGVIVSPGGGEIHFEFHTPGMLLGILLSTLGVLVCAALIIQDSRRAKNMG